MYLLCLPVFSQNRDNLCNYPSSLHKASLMVGVGKQLTSLFSIEFWFLLKVNLQHKIQVLWLSSLVPTRPGYEASG